MPRFSRSSRGRSRPCPSTARRGGSCRPADQLDRAVLGCTCGVVPQQAVEGAFAGHLGQRRHRPLVAQQRLRRHQDQRLAEVALHLPAQDVEVVGRRRDSWRPACCLRRRAAGSARGGPRSAPAPGLRSRAAAADEARHAQPLALARRDELVEDHLRAVGEVAELRFPQRQRVRLGQRIAVLEAEHRFFREHRVDDLVARPAPATGC